jgi:hypothetical protein
MKVGRACGLGLWLSLSGLCACTDPLISKLFGASPAPRPRPQVAHVLFLNEPFQIAGESCRVTGAKSALVESSALPYPKARVRPDVRALEVLLHCENSRGEALEVHEALPEDSVVLLELSQGKTLAARPQNGAPDRLVFDLPDDLDPELPAARRFDADSGQSVVPREHAIARFSLRTGKLAIAVSLRQRYHDAALDALVDRLALLLAQGSDLSALARDAAAETGLRELASTYAEVRQRFHPARLALTQLEAGSPEARTLTLSLTRPKNHESAFEVARFQLTLAQTAEAGLRIASFDNREAAKNALACAELQDDLRIRLRDSHLAARGVRALNPSKSAASCNALGLLLPAACNEVDAQLLARALEVGVRCGAPFTAMKTSQRSVPADFQLTLRRGRAEKGLDRSPRYVVSLFHGGQVVFHGKHWVESQERSDGRTDLGLLAGLYESIRALDFFARRGGEYDPEHCAPSDDQGDVMTVIAGDKQRMVLNRAGCRGPFSEGELTELRRQVERVAGLSAWTQKGMSIADQDAEQWAIAE